MIIMRSIGGNNLEIFIVYCLDINLLLYNFCCRKLADKNCNLSAVILLTRRVDNY